MLHRGEHGCAVRQFSTALLCPGFCQQPRGHAHTHRHTANLVVEEVGRFFRASAPHSSPSFQPGHMPCAGTLLLIPRAKFLVRRKKATTKALHHDRSLTSWRNMALNADLYRASVGQESPICGKTLASLHLRREYGIEILEVRTGDQPGRLLKKIVQEAPTATTVINSGDSLYIRGSKEDIGRFVVDFRLTLDATNSNKGKLQFYDIGIAEIVPLPNSPVLKDSIAALEFSKKFGVNVIGIRHKNTYVTSNLGDCTVRQGDVLLVQGTWRDIDALSHETANWVVLGQPLSEAAKVTLDYKAPVAAIIMALMVVSLVFEFLPAVISVILAALAMVLTGCFRNVSDAYKTINWESIVLIAAMMPMSFALEKTGVSEMVSSSLVEALGGLGPHWLLAGVYFTTSIMTLFISNTATAVLLAPIALESAVALESPICGKTLASLHLRREYGIEILEVRTDALVMPAGQYAFMDYIKVGLPLQLLLGVLMIFVLPLLFPF